MKVLGEIAQERFRQEQLKAGGKFKYTCADAPLALDFARCATVLGEEFGEVAKEVCDLITASEKNDDDAYRLHRANLRTELIQVAAVAMAWVEGLDR